MVMLLLVGLSTLSQDAQALEAAVFVVKPNTLSIDPGQSFTMTVGISSGGDPIASGSVRLSYNQSLFQISSIDALAPWSVTLANATSLTFTVIAGPAPNASDIAVVHFNTLSTETYSNSRIFVHSPTAISVTGAPVPAVPSEALMNLYVSTKGTEAGFPWWVLIPAIIVIAAIPPAVYLLRKKAPTPLVQPSQSDRDKRDDKKPDYTLDVVRKEDLLALTFDFYNFKLQKTVSPAKLIRIVPGAPAYMSVTFQGQNINERAYFEVNKNVDVPKDDKDANAGDTDKPKAPPVPAILAGKSRLVFRIPSHVNAIEYSLKDLLAWTDYDLNVVPVAMPDNALELDFVQAPQIRKPEDKETAIEVPYRMIISPSRFGGWTHSRSAVEHGGWTELWHTRLGVRRRDGATWTVDEQDASERIVRAVWSPDYSSTSPPNANNKGAFRSSMTPRDRHEIVRLTSDIGIKDEQFALAGQLGFSSTSQAVKHLDLSSTEPKKAVSTDLPQKAVVTGTSATPKGASTSPEMAVQDQAMLKTRKGRPPVRVNRLMLSTLGAWIDSRGSWEPPSGLSVMEWVHRGTQGRDHYVKVVYKGFLFPLGHRASLVKVTERKFMRVPSMMEHLGQDSFIAYLRQRMYIVVLEQEKEYSPSGRNSAGRDWPFIKVDIVTEVTPNIDKPEDTGVKLLGIKAFWPMVNTKDFLFRVRAEDVEGQRTEFDTPLIFIMNEIAYDPNQLNDVYTSYPGEEARRNIRMFGQRVAFAQSSKPGDTILETDAMHLGCERPNLAPPFGQPYFYPILVQYDVNIPSVAAILGRKASLQLNYDQTFLDSEWDQGTNKGEVFATIVPETNLKLDFPADKAGGLVNPNLSVVGLSRSLGPIGGDVGSIKSGSFDPSSYFKGALSEAKVMGISLLEVIDTAGLDRVPVMVTEEHEDQTKVVMTWTPQLKSSSSGVFVNRIDRNGSIEDATMSVIVTIIKPKSGSQPTIDVIGWIKSFEMKLIPQVETFLAVKFDKVSFESRAGNKLVFDAELFGVFFDGPLSFINALQQYIPQKGFDPPGLEVTPQGVRASYDLGLPTIGFGVFTLANINLSASLNLPFNGDPVRLRFAFCERHRPFLLSVSIFGGGGFFAIALGPDGIEIIEGSLEFGGSVSIDIGVASGAVYVMAGVYFKLETTPQGEKLQLTGYLRCGGALEVLGLICISCEFYMGINYQPSPKRLWGEATLTVEVKVAFFSKSVELTVQREFASSPPPTFEDVVAKLLDWTDYCEAFE